MEQYQAQVRMLTRMHEDESEIQENKMQAIKAQNESLKIHLKLAVESLKNPIKIRPLSTVPTDENQAESTFSKDTNGKVNLEDEENEERVQYWENWADLDPYELEREEEAKDVQDYMRELMQQTALFRRRIQDDKRRFGDDILKEKINAC